MRDLGQVLAHVHDAQIEIREGPVLAAQGDSLETPQAGRRSSLGAGEKRPPTEAPLLVLYDAINLVFGHLDGRRSA
jgi:hypothetical protein